MELKDILEDLPGLSRRFIYYLEARGYITPSKIRKRRIARRDYSQQDLKVVREVWRYYQRGYSLQSAYELATQTERIIAYIGVQAPLHQKAQILEALRQHPQVVEASGVYGGASTDILIKTSTPDESEIYHVLVPFLAEQGLAGLPQVSVASAHFQRPQPAEGKGQTTAMMAYVLMKVPGKDVGRVMEQLKAITAIKEASTIYGESDIIAKVEVPDQLELDSLVMGRLHAIPAVESTRTFIVVQRLHWMR